MDNALLAIKVNYDKETNKYESFSFIKDPLFNGYYDDFSRYHIRCKISININDDIYAGYVFGECRYNYHDIYDRYLIIPIRDIYNINNINKNIDLYNEIYLSSIIIDDIEILST